MKVFVTRESCWTWALWWWLMLAFMAPAYWIYGQRPMEEWLPYALGFALVASLLLLMVALRISLVQDLRETMCSWGSGKADVTKLSYFVIMPFYALFYLISLVTTARQQLQLEAEGQQSHQELLELMEAPADSGSAARCQQCQRPLSSGGTCAFCGVAKKECPHCGMKCPPKLAVCQYCRKSMT